MNIYLMTWVAFEDEECTCNHNSSTVVDTETEDQCSLSTTIFYNSKIKKNGRQNSKMLGNFQGIWLASF